MNSQHPLQQPIFIVYSILNSNIQYTYRMGSFLAYLYRELLRNEGIFLEMGHFGSKGFF